MLLMPMDSALVCSVSVAIWKLTLTKISYTL